MITIRQYMRNAAETLKSAGIDAPAFEAGVILCHVLNCNRPYLYSHDDMILQGPELEKLNSILLERSKNIPLQYLIGETEFMSLNFKVSPAVLIPRQDTEILAEKCIELVKELSKPDKDICDDDIRVLDMCTGSGCIAVSVAYYCPESRVVACDLSRSALEIAKINSEQAGVQSRVAFRCGDLFEALDGGGLFDIIASNPPYIETEAVKGLQIEVREHEPYMALDGGADGLDFYRRIVGTAPGFLKEGGYLALEIGYNQGESVSRLMEGNFSSINVLKDFGQNDRVVVGRLKK